MAIIKLTQKNFTRALADKIDEFGGAESMFASMLLGGKDKLKEAVASTPDEHVLWVNTNHVVATSGLIKAADTGQLPLN